MRLLHTADWQLGHRAQQAGDAAAAVRQRRLEAAARVVELAHQESVDLVLIAGDTFDGPDIDETIFGSGLEILESFAPIPVFLLPGNHDPLEAGGIWSRLRWQQTSPHLTLLTESAELEALPGLVLYPCPIRQRRSRKDPTSWIPERRSTESGLRVGVAHGALDTLPEGANFPIAVDRAQRCGLDYLALGDWHSMVTLPRVAYPGTIEGSRFGEKDPGHVLLVELEASAAAPPRIEPRRVGRLEFKTVALEVRDATDLERGREELLSHAPEDTLARIHLRLSTADEHLRLEVEALRGELEDRLLFLDWSWELEPEAGELPAGLARQVDDCLGELEAGGEVVLSAAAFAAEPEVVREARRLLRQTAPGEEG